MVVKTFFSLNSGPAKSPMNKIAIRIKSVSFAVVGISSELASVSFLLAIFATSTVPQTLVIVRITSKFLRSSFVSTPLLAVPIPSLNVV